MNIAEKYPYLTAEEYRSRLNNIFDKIQHTQALRYFYIFTNEMIAGHSEMFMPDHMSENKEEEVING